MGYCSLRLALVKVGHWRFITTSLARSSVATVQNKKIKHKKQKINCLRVVCGIWMEFSSNKTGIDWVKFARNFKEKKYSNGLKHTQSGNYDRCWADFVVILITIMLPSQWICNFKVYELINRTSQIWSIDQLDQIH